MADATLNPGAGEVLETPTEAAEHARTCANCGTSLLGPFCHACGQKGHLHGRLRHLVEELAEGVAHFDGRFWRTLPLLAFNPGRLSREWRAGRRVRYVAPLHVFLFAVFLFFLIPTLTGQRLIQLEDIRLAEGAQARAEAEALDRRLSTDPALSPEERRQYEAGRAFIEKRVADREYYLLKIETLIYKLAFLLVPISMAILAVLLALKRGFTFYDHGVVSLYGLSMLVLALCVVLLTPAGVVGGWIDGLVLLGVAVHATVHLRGAYGLSWPGATVRSVLLGAFSLVGFTLFLLGVVALGLAG